jgi:tetratricopeptide (TPR) repeat protein
MKILIGGLFSILVLFSCSHPDGQVKLLQQAQLVVENEPLQALNLLDSISNPEGMGKDYYMQYIVAKVQAKYNVHQDITRDTLILEAQKYFEDTDNQGQAMLANYYVGSLYYGKDNRDMELEYTNRAEYYAHKTANNLYTGKCLNIKGSIYYDKRLLDSAIVKYKEALIYYQKCENIVANTLDVIRMIGLSYYNQNNMDSAYFYFNEGFQLANQKDNKAYQSTFTHMLGANYLKQNKYKEASVYLNKALAKTKKEEERQRIYQTLLNLYNCTNQLDSADYFSKKLEEVLPKVTYIYTLQGSYDALAEYYRKAGNHVQAAVYKDSLTAVNQRISDFQNLKKIAEIEYKHTIEIQQKEMEKLRMRNCIIWICTIAVIIALGVIYFFRARYLKRERKREKEKNRIISEQLDIQDKLVKRLQEILSCMKDIYSDISNEWVDIEKEVQKLTKEFGVTKEPELFTRVKQLVKNFKQNTNRQLVEIAKGYFIEHSYGKKAMESLNDRELLVFMLYYCGYTRKDVSLIIGVGPSKENMLYRKLNIRNKLVKAGMPEDEIISILFDKEG